MAALDHVSNPAHAVLHAAVVMLELSGAGLGKRAEMRNDRVSATDIEDTPAGEVRRGPVSRGSSFFVERIWRCHDCMPSSPTFDLDTRQPGLCLTGPGSRDQQCAFALSELVFKTGNRQVKTAPACYYDRCPVRIHFVL